MQRSKHRRAIPTRKIKQRNEYDVSPHMPNLSFEGFTKYVSFIRARAAPECNECE